MILIGTFVPKIKNLVQCAGSAGHCPAYRVKMSSLSVQWAGGELFFGGRADPSPKYKLFFHLSASCKPFILKSIHDVDKLSTIVVE